VGVIQEEERSSVFHDMDQIQMGSTSAADQPIPLSSELYNRHFAIGPQADRGHGCKIYIDAKGNKGNFNINFNTSTDNPVHESTSSESIDYEINEVSDEPR